MIVKCGYALTVNTGNFNNFKPEVSFEIDTEKDVEAQLADAKGAIRAMLPVLSGEMENILDVEGMVEYQPLVESISKAQQEIETRLNNLETIVGR